jgi:opacity protein-like surface antigen
MHAGFALGAGFGTEAFGPRVSHDIALGSVHLGWIPGEVVGEDTWYRGNWEVLGELFGGAQFNPNHRYLFGLSALLRYNFATGSRWVPFFDGGAGISYTNIREPDLSTRFQFNVQFGAGTHYFVRRDLALTLQYRWLHLSNAGIEEPNEGTNTQMFLVGTSWFF